MNSLKYVKTISEKKICQFYRSFTLKYPVGANSVIFLRPQGKREENDRKITGYNCENLTFTQLIIFCKEIFTATLKRSLPKLIF